MADVSDTGSHPDAGQPRAEYDDPDSHADRLAAEREAMELVAAQAAPAAPPAIGRVPVQTRSAPEPAADPAFGDLVPWLLHPDDAPKRVRRHGTRGPALGLTATIALTLAAAFFGWVSAQPFWLAVGLGHTGTATIASCDRDLDSRCIGSFIADDGKFVTQTVRLSGVPDKLRRPDASMTARILHEDSEWAYVGSLGMRWKIGVLAALLCCGMVPVATGVRRMRNTSRGGRATLWVLGVVGPMIVTIGVMAAVVL